MPYFEVLLYGNRLTHKQRDRLFRDVTGAAERALGVVPEQVRIGIHEWPAESGFDGSKAGRERGATRDDGDRKGD